MAHIASVPLACFVVFAAFASPHAVAPSDARSPDASAKPPANTTTVRAELAAVLLQSKKYDDAAREYRALLARDASNVDYRLGLARALAWGDQPREAEIELRALQAKRVQPATVDTLLRSVRDAMEPRASEAATWVAERRDYAPYRLAYARALAREHYNWIASAQYDTLSPARARERFPSRWCCDASRRARSSTRAISPEARRDFATCCARRRATRRCATSWPTCSSRRIDRSKRARSTTR